MLFIRYRRKDSGAWVTGTSILFERFLYFPGNFPGIRVQVQVAVITGDIEDGGFSGNEGVPAPARVTGIMCPVLSGGKEHEIARKIPGAGNAGEPFLLSLTAAAVVPGRSRSSPGKEACRRPAAHACEGHVRPG